MTTNGNGKIQLETLRKWLQLLIIPLAIWAVSIQVFKAEAKTGHEATTEAVRAQAKSLEKLQDIVTENALQIGILLDREERETRP